MNCLTLASMRLFGFRTRSAHPFCWNQWKCRGGEILDVIVTPLETEFFWLVLLMTLHDRILNGSRDDVETVLDITNDHTYFSNRRTRAVSFELVLLCLVEWVPLVIWLFSWSSSWKLSMHESSGQKKKLRYRWSSPRLVTGRILSVSVDGSNDSTRRTFFGIVNWADGTTKPDPTPDAFRITICVLPWYSILLIELISGIRFLPLGGSLNIISAVATLKCLTPLQYSMPESR